MFCEFRLNNWMFCEFRLNNWMLWIHLPRLSSDKLCFMQDSFERNLLPCHTDITCALLCRIVLKRWILCACLWEWHFSWWTSTLVTLIWYVSLIIVIGQNRTTAKRESHLLITSMITDRIGRHEVLLPIIKTMTKFEKETRHRLYIFMKKKAVNSAKCEITARARDVFSPL